MDTLKKKVLDTIQKHNMILPGDKIIIGVSGGPDSTALLYLLHDLHEELSCTLHIAHLDHALRGEESKADAEYVLEHARKFKIPITLEAINIRKMITSKESLESCARRIRYEFYERVLVSVKGDKIAQGHTRDDQAETVLMRLLRGSGSQGLGGIPPVRDKYIRPLIEISRQEVETYLEKLKITPRIDASNLSTEYERNKIRLELIPFLEKDYRQNIKQILQQTGEILRTEDEFLTKIAEDAMNRFADFLDNHTIQIHIPDFAKLHLALQRRALRLALEKLAGNLMGFDYNHITELLSLALYQSTGKMISLPKGIIAEKIYDNLILKCRQEKILGSIHYPVKLFGETFISELSMSIKITETEKIHSNYIYTEDKFQTSFDYDKIQGGLYIRNKRLGDKFQPLGMTGTKKLQDFFVDEKIPKSLRDKIPILTDEDKILWIVGYRMDDRAKITEETKKQISIKVFYKK